MISVSEAFSIIDREVPALDLEAVPLEKVVGRVLAGGIRADSDVPPFDRSQMDGFAVRADDTKNSPATLRIIGESAAGKGWPGTIGEGEAVRIMTGAPLPAGADAVQKLELTVDHGDESVEILEPTKRGKYIVPKGLEVQSGEAVFRAGTVVNERMVAALASFGFSNVTVARQPRVSIMATGSEIVDIDQKPGPDQIRNSNSAMLRAFASRFASPVLLPITRDNAVSLTQAIEKASVGSDLVLITGGVSVGKYDLTKLALREIGAEIFFEKIRLKPGKPTVFARLGDCLIFGLPGNPVSAAVTFRLFVQRSILKMQSASPAEPHRGHALCGGNLKGTKERDSYLPSRLTTDEKGHLIAKPLKWHGSSDFIAFSEADALVYVPQDLNYDVGDVVEFVFLD